MKNILILANNDIGLYKFRKELIEELVKSIRYTYHCHMVSLFRSNFLRLRIHETPISRRGTNPITTLNYFLNI